MERPLESAYIPTKDILSAPYASLRGLERINSKDSRNGILYRECVAAQRPLPNGWVLAVNLGLVRPGILRYT